MRLGDRLRAIEEPSFWHRLKIKMKVLWLFWRLKRTCYKAARQGKKGLDYSIIESFEIILQVTNKLREENLEVETIDIFGGWKLRIRW